MKTTIFKVIGIFVIGIVLGWGIGFTSHPLVSIQNSGNNNSVRLPTNIITNEVPNMTESNSSLVNWTATAKCVDNMYRYNLTYINDTVQNQSGDPNNNEYIKSEATSKWGYECGSHLYNFTNTTNAENFGTYGLSWSDSGVYGDNGLFPNQTDIPWVHYWTQYCTAIWACAYLNRG